MSASNWDTCPACKKKAEADRAEYMERAAKSYGKIPPAQWKAMSDDAAKPVELEETLREDWEIGVDSKGEFAVTYRASCQDCSYEFAYRHKQQTLADPTA